MHHRVEALTGYYDTLTSAHILEQAPEHDGTEELALPWKERKLLAQYEEPFADTAVWMAVTLSAPTVPMRALPASKSSGTVRMVRHLKDPRPPFAPIARARPMFTASGGELVFRAGALNVRTLQAFGIPYQEELTRDVGKSFQYALGSTTDTNRATKSS